MPSPGRLSATFERLRSERRVAFIPFFAAGDPDLDTTRGLLQAAASGGADIIELGVPFSDPIADGPVIQAAFYRALEHGFQVAHVFDLAGRLRRTGFATPLVCMVSFSLVYRRSVRTFLTLCKKAGFDGVIIPDLPVGYEEGAAAIAAELGLDLILLIAPTTTPERCELIVQRSRGFIYYISVTGITGARTTLPEDLAANVRGIKQRSGTPVCVGFGISRPEHAAAVAACADGVIVGSALVKGVAEALAQKLSGAALVQHVKPLLAALAAATHGQPGTGNRQGTDITVQAGPRT
ncbi:MAG: tryptophan synthase subunit alpha [Planctomycetota bacterium]